MTISALLPRTITTDTVIAVEYAITPLGRTLGPLFPELDGWTQDHVAEVESARRRYDGLVDCTGKPTPPPDSECCRKPFTPRGLLWPARPAKLYGLIRMYPKNAWDSAQPSLYCGSVAGRGYGDCQSAHLLINIKYSAAGATDPLYYRRPFVRRVAITPYDERRCRRRTSNRRLGRYRQRNGQGQQQATKCDYPLHHAPDRLTPWRGYSSRTYVPCMKRHARPFTFILVELVGEVESVPIRIQFQERLKARELWRIAIPRPPVLDPRACSLETRHAASPRRRAVRPPRPPGAVHGAYEPHWTGKGPAFPTGGRSVESR